jgi:secreted trypsin-like serine protease
MPRRWVALLSAVVLPLGVMVVAPPMAQAGDVSPQVVNGRPPAAGEFAFLAAIQAAAAPDEVYICGGSFVSSTQIVTAAHCFYDPDGRRITNVSAAPGNGASWPSSFVSASRVEIHSGYSPSSEDNDIAIITLSRAVVGVRTVTIPTAAQWSSLAVGGAPAKSAGWGTTSSGGDAPENFRVADLTVIPDAVCGSAGATYRVGSVTYYGIGSSFKASQMLCAGGATSAGRPIDTCQGDSGGPLVSDTTLVGIVSWGIGCAGSDDGRSITLTPGVYTRLGTYLPWLAERGIAPSASTPGAPTGVRAVATSSTEATVTWTAPSSTGGSAITRYLVQESRDGGAWRDLGETADAATSIGVESLTTGATYQFRVAAINSAGTGAVSQPSAPITMSDAVATTPGAVSGFSVGRFIKRGQTYRVTVAWQPPVDDGGAQITGYVARYGAGSRWNPWTPISGTSAVISSLRPGTKYTVQVQATNEKGPGPIASYSFRTPRR